MPCSSRVFGLYSWGNGKPLKVCGKEEVSQLSLDFRHILKNISFDVEDREPRVGGLALAVSAVWNAFPSLHVPTKLLFLVKTLFLSSVHSKVIPDLSRWNNHSFICPTFIIYVFTHLSHYLTWRTLREEQIFCSLFFFNFLFCSILDSQCAVLGSL